MSYDCEIDGDCHDMMRLANRCAFLRCDPRLNWSLAAFGVVHGRGYATRA